MSELPGMGWLRDFPDHRDYSVDHERILGLFQAAGKKKAKKPSAESAVDLRSHCTPVENQLSLGSCTANAAVGMYEYFERRAFGTYTNASRLFLYKVTRNLMGTSGDNGASLRATAGTATFPMTTS